MPLTTEQRIFAIKRLAFYVPPKVVALEIHERFNAMVNETEIRALDLDFGGMLPPAEAEIYAQTRADVESGKLTVPALSRTVRMIMMGHIATRFYNNNQPGHALGVFERIEAMQQAGGGGGGAPGTTIEQVTKITRTIIDPATPVSVPSEQ